MYKERKIIIVSGCEDCPFYGECKPWKALTSKQRVSLSIGNGFKEFILNGCPLPYGEDGAEPFGKLPE